MDNTQTRWGTKMNLKSIVASVMLAGLMFMGLQLFQSHPVTNTVTAQEQQDDQLEGFAPVTWEYARLVQTNEQSSNGKSLGPRYTFTYGDQIIGRNNPLALNILSRRLSIDNVNQITIDTVLNQLGSERWELIEVRNETSTTTWMFKRIR